MKYTRHGKKKKEKKYMAGKKWFKGQKCMFNMQKSQGSMSYTIKYP